MGAASPSMLPQRAPRPCDTGPVERQEQAWIGLGANVGSARSTLDRLLTRVATRTTPSVETAKAVADWRTDDLYVVTRRPPIG